ncbi:MAG: aminopeptidase, partial [Bacteroidia bacterium]|nr:aminopeptidase [Bacteroidia bacterium]
MTNFILDHVKKEKKNWKVVPKVYSGKGFQDCVVLVFGKPRTAVYAHIDSIGYTVKYEKEVVMIGKPVMKTGINVVGVDSKGKIVCSLVKKSDILNYKFKREINRGTSLTYKPDFRETKNYVQCCYMDNRLGVWNALQIAKTLKNGAIVFSCWEEHGGGSVGYLSKFLYKKYKVDQSLISDITWVTNGVKAGKGCAISMRDSGLPRKAYIDRIIEIAR